MPKTERKIQPHCCVVMNWEGDLCHTDFMFTQILHAHCLLWKPEYIRDTGKFAEIVNKYPDYRKVFLVLKKGQHLQ